MYCCCRCCYCWWCSRQPELRSSTSWHCAIGQIEVTQRTTLTPPMRTRSSESHIRFLLCAYIRMVHLSIPSPTPSPPPSSSLRPPLFPRSRSAPEITPPRRPTDQEVRLNSMSSAFDTFVSYLRIPLLASSGVAALLSGLLYFKQKYGTWPGRCCSSLTKPAKSYIHALSPQMLEQTYPDPRNLQSPTMKSFSYPRPTASR